jgi:hypothetical protein
MKIRTFNRTLAKQDPQGSFASPFSIVQERLLTKGEKIATLDRWRHSILETSSTSDEGMGSHDVCTARTQLLREIEEAKNWLRSR